MEVLYVVANILTALGGAVMPLFKRELPFTQLTNVHAGIQN